MCRSANANSCYRIYRERDTWRTRSVAKATSTTLKCGRLARNEHGYLKLADTSGETAALLICDQFKASEPIDLTVEDYHGSWDNLCSTEHVLLANTENKATAQLPDYNRNSKEPRTVAEALKMKDATLWKQAPGVY